MKRNEKLAKILGNNIYQLRLKANLTQNELAKKIEKTQTSVYRYEKGIIVPDILTLINITKVFGVTINEIINNNFC